MFYLLFVLIQMKKLLHLSDLNKAKLDKLNLGFVPTMGALHKGHISLIKASKKKSAKTLVSIFVNPKQFNKKNDFKYYPRQINKDLKILKSLKIDYVFLPKNKDIYKKKRLKKITLKKGDKILCAKFRKGHFEGVLDIMDRFTKIINPKKIYLGEKDFQQFYLIKKFLTKRYSSKIILCPTIRDKNKIALSSRNILLKKIDIIKASQISKYFIRFKNLYRSNKNNLINLLILQKKYIEKKFNVKIEYLELRKKNNLKISKNFIRSKLFLAYKINKVRLIDNF